jgi:hypothetical protein
MARQSVATEISASTRDAFKRHVANTKLELTAAASVQQSRAE